MAGGSTCPICGAALATDGGGCKSCLMLGALTENSAAGDSDLGAWEDEEWTTGGGPTQADGGLEVEGYTVFERIGEGGTAEVFRARQHRPIDRQVALKLVRPGMGSEQLLARFEAERQVLARMQHPHIATVLDAGHTAGGQPFFALEFVDGQPLTDYASGRGLPLAERLELFGKVVAAVHHAHQRGIVHRDLKPSNILVDRSGEPKVIDFGIARALEGDLDEHTLFVTREGDFLGTPAYMSPEQARGQIAEIDTRTDIYSLGVVLYELLTGRLPVAPDDLRAALAGGETKVERPSRRETATSVRREALRGDIDWVVMRALEHDKERRYDSAAAFGEDVARFLRNEPVSAGPPTASYRLRKFVRRNRGLVAGLALALVAMVAGTAVSVWQALRATAAEGDALASADAARAAEAEAVREREIANAVNDFLIDDLLGAVDFDRTADPDVTLLELVDRAAAKAAERFGGKPRVGGTVHETIAGVYESLGRNGEAFDQYARARDAFASLPEEVDARPHLRRVVRAMAAVRFRERRLPEARALFEEALAIWDGPGVPEESRRSAAMFDASLLAGEGDDAGSIAALRELAGELEGEGGEFAGQVAYNLGLAMNRVGRPDEAIPYLQRFADWLGDAPTGDRADALTELAKAKHYCGRSDEAEADLLAAAEIQHAVREPGHPARLLTDEALASLYDDTGRLGEAKVIYERLLAEGLREGEAPSPILLVALHNYGVALLADDPEKSIELLERAVAGRAERFGDAHPMTAESRYSLGITRFSMGDTGAAMSIWERVRDDRREALGAGHPETLAALRILAKGAFLLGDQAAGLKHARELLAEPVAAGGELAAAVAEQRTMTYAMLEGLEPADRAAWRDLALAVLASQPGDRQAWGVLGRALAEAPELAGVAAAAERGEGVAAALGAVPEGRLQELLGETPEALRWLRDQR